MAWEPDYVTSAEFKAYLKIADSDDDAQVAFAISAASRAVDKAAGRQFGQVAVVEERFYTAQWDRRRCRWVVDTDDLMTATDLAVEVADGAVTDYELAPTNAEFIGRPWTQLIIFRSSAYVPSTEAGDVAVTARWGWSAVPPAVKQATLIQASRFLARRDSPYGVAGSPDLGNELRLLAAVDPDVRVALSPYRRVWGAV